MRREESASEMFTSNKSKTQVHLDDTEQSSPDKTAKARHREIAVRYAWDGRRRGKPRDAYHRIANIRMRELERLFEDRHGDTLPDDRRGRDCLIVAFHHIIPIAEFPDPAIKQWASAWAPWIGPDELETIIEGVFEKPQRWAADRLAWWLRLTDADRTRLRITTIGSIDVGKAARIARRKKRNKEAKAAKRHALGAQPRKASLARTQPWKKLGMSRAKWFRKGKPTPPARRHNETVETVSGTADEDILLEPSVEVAVTDSKRPPRGLTPRSDLPEQEQWPERRAEARARSMYRAA